MQLSTDINRYKLCTELKNRGVQDILIACVDGLKGFPEAINTVFSGTEIQLCIIHSIRNTLRYIASKDQKLFMKELRLAYRGISKKWTVTPVQNWTITLSYLSIIFEQKLKNVL